MKFNVIITVDTADGFKQTKTLPMEHVSLGSLLGKLAVSLGPFTKDGQTPVGIEIEPEE